MIGTLARKLNPCLAVYNKSGRKKNELSEEEDQTLRLQLPEEGILSTLKWTMVKESMSKLS